MKFRTLNARLGRFTGSSVAAVLLLPLSQLPATAANPERVYLYAAKRSDTFLALAGRFLADRNDGTLLARYNPTVDPAKIPIGHQIRIPVAAMRAEFAGASVVSVRGQVEANNQKLLAGQVLAERDKIKTGDNGFVTIKLADGSTLTIQSKSAVQLERTRRLANTTVGESVVRLDRGRLETVVTKQNAAAKYEVRTPTSNMGVRGTLFRAGTDENGKKAFSEVIEGAVGVTGRANSLDTGGLLLKAGFGAVVEADMGASGPIKLLPPPSLPTLTSVHTRPTLNVTFPAVVGASGYRAQVAFDRSFLQLVGEVVSTKPSVELGDLPDGTLQLRVRAIDPAGLEGLDSVTSFSVGARPFPPRLISPIDGATVAAGHASFSWAVGAGAVSYRFQIAANEAFAPVLIERALIAATHVDIPIASADSRYYWRVAAIDANGKQGPFGESQSATVRAAAKLKITPVVMGRISQLKWKSGTDDFYHVEVSRHEMFHEIVQSRVTAETTLVLNNLPTGTYFVRVRGVANGSSPGNIKQPGEWSDTEVIEVFGGLF
ncbi:MAG: FecR domain-containing protein [Rhodocyclaceae bacterium]|nr:FecR domain-containing protein [Rhodocyclaceae bacterium]